MDVVKIEAGLVTQVWRNHTLEQFEEQTALVETDQPVVAGMSYDGAVFSRPPLPLGDAQEIARKAARAWLRNQEQQPVTALGLDWHGGYESAQRLDGARRLALEANLTEVVFTDTSNKPHTLTLDDARTVCLAVGGAYQAAFAQKQAWMVEIDAAQTTDALPVIP